MLMVSDWCRKFKSDWLTLCHIRGNYDDLDGVNTTVILEIIFFVSKLKFRAEVCTGVTL